MPVDVHTLGESARFALARFRAPALAGLAGRLSLLALGSCLTTCYPAAKDASGCPACPPCENRPCAGCPPAAPCDCHTTNIETLPPSPRTTDGIARTEAELVARYEGRRAVQVFEGKATYYGNQFTGRTTANGEVYDPNKFTAAHRKLPFNTVVRVVRKDTNKYVYVRINDRGPYAGNKRIIDLSYVAAERLGMIRAGVVPVRVEVLD